MIYLDVCEGSVELYVNVALPRRKLDGCHGGRVVYVEVGYLSDGRSYAKIISRRMGRLLRLKKYCKSHGECIRIPHVRVLFDA